MILLETSSKTVQGTTTTYKYDKANQLVSSECNGKIMKYEYDAAGRLVKEGKRSYSHLVMDKVSRVKMDGRQEHFLWDNLALISRNETEYVNEPYVTGGNPILADEDVLFNDMLGSTIGIRSGKEYRETGMTAFGETDEKSAMFTGKPYIGELGYAFLFRNYRPGLGKWQTSDPLGYPDGWNNFAYVNNGVTMHFDFLGGKIGDGKWEWEPAGPDDDQRFELTDDYYVGENPYKIMRAWDQVQTFSLGSAYVAETRTYSFNITVGCEGGLEIPGLGLSISQSTSETVSYSFSTGKGEKAQYLLYQLVETYQFFENGVVAKTVVARTNTISKLVKGWKWLE